MNKKIALTTVSLLLALSIAVNVVLADVFVGVKKGDYIVYKATYTGNPPPGHSVTGARMEIVDVQGASLTIKITSYFTNGTNVDFTTTLNLETGQLGDDFIIPANLKVGDIFYDKNVGNITIAGSERRTYVGATRNIIYATVSLNTYYWDQATGISVEGISQTSDYNMHSLVDSTNMWQPQIFGFDSLTFYWIMAIMIAVVAVIVASVAIIFVRRRK